jgi:hypothetical protein
MSIYETIKKSLDFVSPMCYIYLMAISHTTAAPTAIKTTTPEWLDFDLDDVESALPDPHDIFVDWADAFELEPPF